MNMSTAICTEALRQLHVNFFDISYESLPPNFSLLQNMAAGAFAGIAVRVALLLNRATFLTTCAPPTQACARLLLTGEIRNTLSCILLMQ